jgi:hypothetical protein
MGGVKRKRVGYTDKISSSKATPFLYCHLKLDEGSGDILNDSSGNGRHLTWNTEGTNATADAAGIWASNGIAFGSVVTGDEFVGSNTSEFPFEIPDYTWVCAVQFTRTGALSNNASLFGSAGSSAGQSGINIILRSSDNDIIGNIREGTVNVAQANPATASVLDEKTTFLCAFDAVENKLYGWHATDTTVTQYEATAGDTPSSVLTEGNIAVAVGIRGAGVSADRANNYTLHNVRVYFDLDGGALPNNLADITRWLHENPTANIPAEWWS